MITIFTPTYNRAANLPKLYDSLIKQTYDNFEWVIVDDGSTDNTEELIKSFISGDKIKINYFKQINGGKHRAINKGVDLAQGELFFIVDSDDWLPENSLEIIDSHRYKIKNEVIGLAGRRQYPDNIIIGSQFPSQEFVSNHTERRYKLNIDGDLAEVITTDVLRKYKFPDIMNEKFCAEGLVWNRISTNGYKLLFFDEPIYYCDYLEGGLSDNSIRNRRKSANYATLLYKELAKSSIISIKQKARAYINFWRFAPFNGKSTIVNMRFIDYNLLGLMMMPFGWLMKKKDDVNDNVKINRK